MFDELLARQSNVIARGQALQAGLHERVLCARLRSGSWQRIFPGVYATFSGPVPRISRLWAAVLRGGAGAMLSHETAAEVCGLITQPSDPIHVMVPSERRVRPVAGVVIHRSHRAAASRHPARTLPQTRVEETVLDLIEPAKSTDEVFGWIAKACAGRFTTVLRLLTAARARPKARWHGEVMAALDDVRSGCHSVLERRYLRDVERAHGLPTGARQTGKRIGRAKRYDDVRHDEFALVVELDGRAAHPDEVRWRDIRRDNDSAAAGDRVLRYGWPEIADQPCASAAQTAQALQAGGWTGAPRRCTRPDCVIVDIHPTDLVE